MITANDIDAVKKALDALSDAQIEMVKRGEPDCEWLVLYRARVEIGQWIDFQKRRLKEEPTK